MYLTLFAIIVQASTLTIHPDQVMQRAKTTDNWESSCSCIPQRWLFTIIASVGLCVQTIFAVTMSITIIEMVVLTESASEQDNESCPSSDYSSSMNQTSSEQRAEETTSAERYSWDEYTQGLILSSFSWSNVIVQFFYGSVAERFGGKHLLGFAILGQAVITFITPFAIAWGGSTALIITRVLIGIGSDGMYPVVSTMISHWSTPSERTKMGNAIYASTVLGLFFGNILPVLIIKYSGMGWPAVFYIFGILGIVWFPFWLFLVYEDPEVHPYISKKELNHLQSALNVDQSKSKLPSAPWKHILLCKEFWVFTVNYIGGNWGYYLMLSDLPKYMGEVVKFPLESNGYFSALPYLFLWLNTNLSGWINDKLLEKRLMSLTNVRKLFNTVSITGPGIFLLFASYAECDKTMVVIMFMIGITLIGGFYTSTLMNPLDLSPNYAGSVMSAGAGIAQIVAILAPYLIGVLAPNSTINEWRVVFWIVFLFAVVTNAIYLFCFKAEVQPWNDPNFVRSKTKFAKMKKEVDLEL